MSLEQIAPPIASLNAPAGQTTSLEHGRLIYLQVCSRCHAAPHILEYTPAEWDTILPDMLDESDLTASRRDLITAYVSIVMHEMGPTPLDSGTAITAVDPNS